MLLRGNQNIFVNKTGKYEMIKNRLINLNSNSNACLTKDLRMDRVNFGVTLDILNRHTNIYWI